MLTAMGGTVVVVVVVVVEVIGEYPGRSEERRVGKECQ